MPVLNRRMLGVLALGATLSACGGGGDDGDDGDNGGGAVAPVALGQVVASTWSDSLPQFQTGDLFFAKEYAGVGASGLIYFRGTEQFDEGYAPVLKQYKPDGTLVSATRLPISVKDAFPEQIAVLEEQSTDVVLIAVALTVNSGMINTKITAGGYIARLHTPSGEITKLFESSTVCPGGLARDSAGSLYTMDMKTGNVLRFSPGQKEASVIYSAKPGASASTNVFWDFVWDAKCMVAVTTDGTVYVTLSGSHVASEASYGRYGAQLVRLRNGQADQIKLSLPEDGAGIKGLSAHGNSVFCLVKSQKNTLVRKIDAAGAISTVAGTPDSNAKTEFGSPGVLSQRTQWIDLTPDGRIHFHGHAQDNPRFYSVLLPANS